MNKDILYYCTYLKPSMLKDIMKMIPRKITALPFTFFFKGLKLKFLSLLLLSIISFSISDSLCFNTVFS